jgi:hypothetical protein
MIRGSNAADAAHDFRPQNGVDVDVCFCSRCGCARREGLRPIARALFDTVSEYRESFDVMSDRRTGLERVWARCAPPCTSEQSARVIDLGARR